jgi:hypothetical protein
MGWAGHAAHRASLGKPEGKRSLERLRRRREDSIKINIEEMCWMDMDWISVTQNRQVTGLCKGGHEFSGSKGRGESLD